MTTTTTTHHITAADIPYRAAWLCQECASAPEGSIITARHRDELDPIEDIRCCQCGLIMLRSEEHEDNWKSTGWRRINVIPRGDRLLVRDGMATAPPWEPGDAPGSRYRVRIDSVWNGVPSRMTDYQTEAAARAAFRLALAVRDEDEIVSLTVVTDGEEAHILAVFDDDGVWQSGSAADVDRIEEKAGISWDSTPADLERIAQAGRIAPAGGSYRVKIDSAFHGVQPRWTDYATRDAAQRAYEVALEIPGKDEAVSLLVVNGDGVEECCLASACRRYPTPEDYVA